MSKNSAVAVVATLVLASAVAVAGTTYPNSSSDVDIVHYSGGGWAEGSIGAVRNSPDNTQYLGCYVRTQTSSEFATCYARSASGTYGSCTTTNWRLIDAIQAISDATRFKATWNASFECTAIEVREASTEEPRQL